MSDRVGAEATLILAVLPLLRVIFTLGAAPVCSFQRISSGTRISRKRLWDCYLGLARPSVGGEFRNSLGR
jgi:hypothetical protein